MKKILKIYWRILVAMYAIYGLSTAIRDGAWKQHIKRAEERGENTYALHRVRPTDIRPVLFHAVANFKEAYGHFKEACR